MRYENMKPKPIWRNGRIEMKNDKISEPNRDTKS